MEGFEKTLFAAWPVVMGQAWHELRPTANALCSAPIRTAQRG
jgi:hypothetical protein